MTRFFSRFAFGFSSRGLTAALALGVAATVAAPVLAEVPPAHAWEIGPIIKGRNYSVGMPLQPEDTREGITFDIPNIRERYGHVHYVTFDPGSLRGARSITMRYRVDAAPGTRFVPQESTEEQAYMSLFFQRRGDSWNAKGPYEHFRWYSPSDRKIPLRAGTHTVTFPLGGDWISVYGKPSSQNPEAFRAALAQAGRVGFTFGSDSGRGHGVYATGRASFTLLDFEIE